MNLTGTVGLRPSINWTKISRIMNRPCRSCQDVWKSIYKQRWKKGRYTKEEDEFIIEKIVEAKKNTSTGKVCLGLRVSIGKELNRDPELVLHRWNNKLSKIKSLDDIEKMKS